MHGLLNIGVFEGGWIVPCNYHKWRSSDCIPIIRPYIKPFTGCVTYLIGR
nr:MAG TPA: hypothetical protein [Caudoviricetes sp.]